MQPKADIKFHPVELDRHGLNPHGDPLWRVVWAESRTSVVYASGKRHTIPRYFHEKETRGHWILERWAPPEVVVGLTRDQYEAMLSAYPGCAAEEYPERGDYELSRIFNEDSGPFARNIDEVALHKQLYFHQWRHERMSDSERAQEVVADEAAKEAETEQKFEALFDEAHEETACLQK